jgi:hypothetical protein
MKTDDLIAGLARDTRPRPAGLANRRFAAALAVGGGVTFAVVALWLKCQPLLEVSRQPWFWMKAAYTGALVVPSVLIVQRLSRPGLTLRRAPLVVVAIAIVMGLLGAWQILLAPPDQRMDDWLGESWSICSPLILLLSVPIYACRVMVIRTLAPTRPTLAGAGAGLLSGALAATLYGLHCPEQGAAFVATWYSLGIVAAAALGAAAGRWLLRW